MIVPVAAAQQMVVGFARTMRTAMAIAVVCALAGLLVTVYVDLPPGGVIVLLLWMWLINLALLFGVEFDAETERGRELQAGIKAERQVKRPPRDTRQIVKARRREAKQILRGRRLRLRRR